MNCTNCNREVSDNFCSHCGQRTHVKRITLKEGWFDFWARVYGFDGMFPRTLRDLTIRPGVAAQKFIDGNRTLYYGPVGYFFLMITVFLLILSFMNMDFVEFMKGMQKVMALEQTNQFQDKFQRLVSDNLKLFVFMQIPFQAFAAQRILFRKSGKNFLEHTVLPFYAMGHLYWLVILSAIFYKISGSLEHGFIQPIISLLYLGFAYSTFMTYQSKVKAFLKGIFVYVISMVLFIVSLTLILIAYVVYLGLTDPESLKLIKQ